ncbi:ABC transporter ATP-binding protein [Bellilinea sp.]|jgi:ABC-2 type transport system ATP-binding protein|uniref:ABC transporter ATP-binding protein n=1 Tax=Bellilinea sp. TaxID=2838785 RepID=UPI002ADE7E69|nr:ATP-binding cassette domain-containing protein [Bellilinea sp.]
MTSIQVNQISKRFGSQQAVDQVSFEVEPGEIFGLLGPNGAGKTTTIRIILDIFKPDSGEVVVLGGKMSEEKKNRIGYLPEERGLYQDITLETCLNYLARLKGLKPAEAAARVEQMMKRFDLYDHRKKKVKELSKGMQQKAQLIITLVHDPQLIIIDEPFSALDPVNTQMVKDLLREERDKGKTIVMCSHQMHQVEELCDRLVLINRGKVMLYGKLNDIRRQYSGQEVIVHPLNDLPAQIPGVNRIERENSAYILHLADQITPQTILKNLVDQGIALERFEIALPTLDEIFIQVVTARGEFS